MNDVKIITVRRAQDDSGWHIRFSIDGIEQPAWVQSEGYLDREWLKDILAEKVGFKRPPKITNLHADIKMSNFVLDGSFSVVPETKSPPRMAELIFAWLAPAKSLHAQLGDLQETFEKNCVRFGERRARWLYQVQVLRSIGPGLWRRTKRLGLIAFLIDYGRSKIGW